MKPETSHVVQLPTRPPNIGHLPLQCGSSVTFSQQLIKHHLLQKYPRQWIERLMLRHVKNRLVDKIVEPDYQDLSAQRTMGQLLHAASGRALRRRTRVRANRSFMQ